ncbi:MAG: AAA family ATPase [Spirochaetales bacterium]|nr:AAA family ATPase [Spirochaetales bacterium]
MSSSLELELLGPPVLRCSDKPIEHVRRKAVALLAYLALSPTPQSRDALATLLWPEQGQSSARGNLRGILSGVQQIAGQELVLSEQETLRLNHQRVHTDVEEFRALAQGCGQHPLDENWEQCISRLQEAAALYQNDLLFGFALPDCRDFDEWQFLEGEQLRGELASVLRTLALALERSARAEAALRYAKRLLSLDPLDESTHRLLIRLYAQDGKRTAAIRQYRECRRILSEELEAQPEAETDALYQALRSGDLVRGTPARAGEGSLRPSPATLLPATPLPPAPTTASSDELRLVSVLAMGFSATREGEWGEHPEALLEEAQRWKRGARQLLEDQHASVRDTSAHDLLAVFGWPVAYEDDAERAVHCAFDITRLRGSAALSAGVATGISYVAARAGAAAPGLPAGAPVTRALQLRYQAAPGSVLVSTATRRYTRNAFRYEPLSLQVSAAQQETVYRLCESLTSVRKPYGIEGLEAEMVGRDAELRSLARAWGRAVEGDGQLVTVIGEAGIGKSRLLKDFRTGLDPAGDLLWLEGRCQELARATAYWPILDMLRGYFEFRSEEPETERAGRIAASLSALVERGILAGPERDEIGPVLGSLFALRFGSAWDRRLGRVDPEQMKHRTLRALVTLLGGLSRLAPTVLVFEDLHWSDSLSLELAYLLLEELAERRLLLICVHRPEPGHPCASLSPAASRRCPERYTDIRLRALDLPETSRLVESLLGAGELPAGILDPIFRRSQGNPFYTEEVLRTLVEEGLLRREGGRWRFESEAAQSPAPQGLLSLIQSRCDRLRPQTRRLLQSAAVIGELFSLSVLQEASEDRSRVPDSIQELLDAVLVYEEPSLQEAQYAFRHGLVRQSVYAGIPPSRRTDLHRRTAEAIERLHGDDKAEHYEQLAYHFERSDRPDKAIDYLLKAGEKARRSYLREEAVRCFQRSLALLETAGSTRRRQRQRVQALAGLGKIHEIAGRLEEMESCFRQAVALGKVAGLDNRSLVRLYHGLGVALHQLFRYDELTVLAQEGLRLLGTDLECTEAALMNNLLSYSYASTDEKLYLEYVRRNARILDRLPYSEELIRVYVDVIWAEGSWGDLEAARRWYAVLARKARMHHDLRAQILGRFYEAVVFHFRHGDLRGTLRLLLENLAPIERTGFWQAKCNNTAYIAWIHQFLGELDEALHRNREVIELSREIGYRERHADMNLNTATLLFDLGRPAEGLPYLEKAAALYRSYEPSLHSYRIDLGLPSEEARSKGAISAVIAGGNLIKVGRAYLALGDRDKARAAILEAQRISAATVTDWQLISTMGFAGLEEALNDPRAFRAYCRRYLRDHPLASGTTTQRLHLAPAKTASFNGPPLAVSLTKRLPEGWTWVDPCGDCSYALGGALELRAANGRELWYRNVSAPRVMLPLEGDFCAQALCCPAASDRPAMGGVVIWQDPENFLHVERGRLGAGQLTFRGRLGGENRIIGRGMLQGKEMHLRLERRGERIRALCSPDGSSWFTLGTVTAPFSAAVQVGLFAIGFIVRVYYHGAYREGTAIRFESFSLWQ